LIIVAEGWRDIKTQDRLTDGQGGRNLVSDLDSSWIEEYLEQSSIARSIIPTGAVLIISYRWLAESVVVVYPFEVALAVDPRSNLLD